MSEIIVGASAVVTGQIVDNNRVGFKPTTTIFTLYDKDTRTVINSRTNAVITSSVDTSGNLVHALIPADNALISTTADAETHVIRYRWTYNVSDVGLAEFEYQVRRDKTP